jgi:AcrR family transcriptional regulator
MARRRRSSQRVTRTRKPLTVTASFGVKRVLDPTLLRDGRERIAGCALPLFAQYGYHGTPVRAIADAAGLSVGSIFNYFPEKEDILQFLLDHSQAQTEQALAEVQAEIDRADKIGDPVEVFLGVYRVYITATDRIHRFTLLAYQETKSLRPEMREPLLDRERRFAEALKRAAQPAIDAGAFSSAALDLKVQSLIALCHAWTVRHWAYRQYPSVEDYLAALEPLAVALMSAGRRAAVAPSDSTDRIHREADAPAIATPARTPVDAKRPPTKRNVKAGRSTPAIKESGR